MKFRLLRCTFLSAVVLSPVFSQQPRTSSPTSAPVVSPQEMSEAISKALEKETHSSTSKTKLQSPLEAVAHAWRRKGAKGAEREAKKRGLHMQHGRLPCVIHLNASNNAAQVTVAVKRSRGEILVVQEDRVYAWILVPALRRISLLPTVERIDVDRSVYASGLP